MKPTDRRLVKEFRHCEIYVDDNGQYWQEIHPPQTFPNCKKGILSPNCQPLCGKSVRRPHIGEPMCRLRRVWLGKMPRMIRVRPHTAWVWQDRPHKVAKDCLLALIMPIVEMLWT